MGRQEQNQNNNQLKEEILWHRGCIWTENNSSL
jgi:hypothetical protein